MRNPYDSYLMRKAKPKFLGFYCGKPVYEGDNVNLKQLQQMSLRVATRVNLVDDGGLGEDERKANEMLAKQELRKSMYDIELQKIVLSEGGGVSSWFKSELYIKLAINIALCVVGFFVGHVMFS